MGIAQNAKTFARKHVSRSILDKSYSIDEFYWYSRLYIRFVSHYLDSFLRSGVTEDAVNYIGLIETYADDWIQENPDIHCEKGGVCIPYKEKRQLYIEAVTETI